MPEKTTNVTTLGGMPYVPVIELDIDSESLPKSDLPPKE